MSEEKIKCGECGEMFDPNNLVEVLQHEVAKPHPNLPFKAPFCGLCETLKSQLAVVQKELEEERGARRTLDTLGIGVSYIDNEIANLQSRAEQAEQRVEELESVLLKNSSSTCFSHTDAERLTSGCPVCLRQRVEELEKENLTANREIVGLCERGILNIDQTVPLIEALRAHNAALLKAAEPFVHSCETMNLLNENNIAFERHGSGTYVMLHVSDFRSLRTTVQAAQKEIKG